jgi:hypothetical protein
MRNMTLLDDPTGELVLQAKALNEQVVDPETRRVKLFPAAFWRKLDRRVFLFWCYMTARYGIPTIELCSWLREQIGDRRAIEIGAGNGDLGFHLDIPETDSFCQTKIPWVAASYALSGQIPTRPGPNVEQLDALDAVRAKHAQVVIASWVTHQSDNGAGFTHGVRESDIVEIADYFMIGNLGPHASKPILAAPHQEFSFPWLVSRAVDPTLDRIWVWQREVRGTGRTGAMTTTVYEVEGCGADRLVYAEGERAAARAVAGAQWGAERLTLEWKDAGTDGTTIAVYEATREPLGPQDDPPDAPLGLVTVRRVTGDLLAYCDDPETDMPVGEVYEAAEIRTEATRWATERRETP